MAASAVSKTDPWSGVLKADHDRLVANIDNVALRAGLGQQHKHLIWTHADLPDDLMEWAQDVVASVRQGTPWERPKLGPCFVNDQYTAETAMQSLTGLLVRNFVDARLMRAQDILVEQKQMHEVEGTVILCPDFVIPEYLDGLAAWDKKELVGFVHDRLRDQKPTVLFVGGNREQLRVKMPSLVEMLDLGFDTEGAV